MIQACVGGESWYGSSGSPWANIWRENPCLTSGFGKGSCVAVFTDKVLITGMEMASQWRPQVILPTTYYTLVGGKVGTIYLYRR